MRTLFLSLSLLISLSVSAQECNVGYAADGQRFADNGDGTISDLSTGLMWQKCVFGQTWDGEQCQGTGVDHRDMVEALSNAERDTSRGYFDWRVPNIKELYSIVNTDCRPAHYQVFGPLYLNDYTYSSSTTNIGSSIDSVMSVYIVDGSIKTNLGVRLIRLVRYDI